ncbi:antibiotic biosynthesis monooxygenase family protein [Deinococcus murrayi]|uniref:antibiotic biosynthesis monooxygenase family protein n=1 Tax=Deinococcus murrayi TaxID=68910 RepID=UPI00054FBB80|nr:hypothetical protein [Deinococcus murrayi]
MSLPSAPLQVHYAEARDEAAGRALTAWLDTLPGQPGFVGAELLASPAQPGLLLVASRWASGELPPTVPPGVRAWAFEVRRSIGPG